MSLLTTTSLIVVWCVLEAVESQMVIPPPPISIGNQYGPQDVNSFPIGYQINNNNTGSQDDEVDTNKEGKNPYKMFYLEKDQFRCEECDEKGNIRGNMTYVDGKHKAIRTVTYETKDIPLDPNAQEMGVSSAQSGFSGTQDAYPQQQFIQGQQPIQGHQIYQGQQLIQGQQLQPIAQGPLQAMAQPQQAYQGLPIQAQVQNYQGNQGVLGPLSSNYQSIQQQNPIAPQLQVPLMASNQLSPVAPLAPNTLGNNLYASTALASFPFALPDAVLSGRLAVQPNENRVSSFANNQGPTGLTNSGGYPTMESLAAEAIRNLQPRPTQASLPEIQPVQAQPQQLLQPQAVSDNGFGSLSRRFNFINSNGVDDRPQGPSILSSPSYQQPLFSPTSTGVVFNREPSGAYNFEYKTPDASRKEVADAKNNVVGSYAYRDPSGGVHNVEYNSGIKGFNAREQSIPGAPSAVMPIYLVPAQQPGSVPFTLVAAAGNSPVPGIIDSPVDKTISKDEGSPKASETDETDSMLKKLAQQLMDKMSEEPSGSSEGNLNSQSKAPGEQADE